MTRYTINIGDDFPLGEEPAATGGPGGGSAGRIEHGPRRFRGRTLLRVLFGVALIAVVIHHPFPVLLFTGLVLLLRRKGWSFDRSWFDELRGRVQSQFQSQIWHNGAGPFACNRPDCGRSWKREQPKKPRRDGEGGGGYGAFV